jgi:flagellar basal-body rod protein FlgF
MIKGLFSSSNGMPPMLVRMEVIANNLANTNTTGFKKDDMFVEMMKESGIAPQANAGDLTARLNVERTTDFGEGSFSETNNPLDVALQGKGWFVVQTQEGERYTRNGNFSLSLDGTLITHDGLPVLGTEGRIAFPDLQKAVQDGISISQSGEISSGTHVVGKLRVVECADESKLRKAGDCLFRTEKDTNVEMKDVELPIIRQGFLEESNVDGIAEMIQMIEITRHFESNQKAIAAQDQTLDKLFEIGKF